MKEELAKKLTRLPKKPGVYIFKDSSGLVLYVGKTINLRNRVTSYFKKNGSDGRGPRIEMMISQISDFDYTMTDNETESLILEKNYIKQFKPKYNVDLRDDKNYLFIKINSRDEIPTINYERKPDDKTARYFGPYTSGMSIKDTLRLVRKIFPYCANKKITAKPCFYYHIGKCPGVCFGKISPDEYRNNYIKKIIQFLDGRQTEILKDLQRQMKIFAGTKKYEQAAKVRDQIFALNRMMEKQKLVYPTKIDQDVFSLHCESVAVVNLFKIRDGKLIQKENFVLDNTKQVPPAEILQSFLERYYLEASSVPKEIVLPIKIKEEQLQIVLDVRALSSRPTLHGLNQAGVEGSLFRSDSSTTPSARFARSGSARNDNKRRVKIIVPSKGKKLELLKLGAENARQYLETTTDKHLLEEARLLASLKELQRVLDLAKLPGRIEAYDISNIQGTNPVGSMVVFDFAKPKKEDYRKFKIKKHPPAGGPDDFAMMQEMLERRFKRSQKGEEKTKGNHQNEDAVPSSLPALPSLWPLPDLILIDGGKGQLNAAIKAMSNFQVSNSNQIPIIAIAKKLEEIFLPGKKLPLVLHQNSIALFLLQRIRDEAHRFAVKFHRQLRSKSSLSSVLDQITGIGPAKKKLLFQKFGSAAGVRKASLTQISAIVGSKLAEKIKASI